MRALFLLATLLPALACAQGDCLPKVELPKAWTACAADADCVLASDGCRSCGNYLPSNTQHRADATAKDLAARAAAKCVRTCEACSAAMVKLTCEAGQCRARPVKATP